MNPILSRFSWNTREAGQIYKGSVKMKLFRENISFQTFVETSPHMFL